MEDDGTRTLLYSDGSAWRGFTALQHVGLAASLPVDTTSQPGRPKIVGHRGWSMGHPENCMRGYSAAYNAGVVRQEGDVFKISDGTLVLMHDDTIDGTTTGTGNVEAQTSATWKALVIDTMKALGPGYIAETPPFFDEWLNWATHRNVELWIEPKSGSGGVGADTMPCYRSVNSELVARAWPSAKVVIETFSLTITAAAAADGWRAWYIPSTALTSDIDAAAAAGAWAISFGYTNWTANLVAYARSKGLQTIADSVGTRLAYDTAAALGIDYALCDDPVYISRSQRAVKISTFGTQRFLPGMLGGSDTNPLPEGASRGVFDSVGWGLPYAATADACLMGHMSPINNDANANSWTMVDTFRFLGIGATSSITDATRWAGQHVCCPTDRRFRPSANAASGLHILIRGNGAIAIETSDDTGGLSAAPGSSSAAGSGALALNTDYILTTTVTPTTFTASYAAASAPGVVLGSASTTSTKRGGYHHRTRNGSNVRWKSIVVTTP